MVTITDISKACGVSRATVSKALNGAADISQETAKRIRDTAAALGYLPNAAARALKLGRSYNNALTPNQYQLVNTNIEFFAGNQWLHIPETEAILSATLLPARQIGAAGAIGSSGKTRSTGAEGFGTGYRC